MPSIESTPVPSEPVSSGSIRHGVELTDAHVGPVEGARLAPSGALTTTTHGQVIENLHVSAPADISAAIIVRHNDVTIRNVHVTAPGSTSGIRIESGLSGTLIEHVTIDGRKAQYGVNRDDANWGNVGVKGYSPFTLRRADIYDVRQGVQAWSGAVGSTIIENYIRRTWMNAPGVSTAGISYRGSTRNTNLTTISRNKVTNSGMSGVSMYAESGPIRNVQVFDNLIVGTRSEQMQTGYGIRGGYVHSHRDSNHDIRIEGNRFDGSFQWGTNGAVNTNQPGNTFTNNRWINSNTDQPPKLELGDGPTQHTSSEAGGELGPSEPAGR
jgi:hypothetical protein